MGGPDRVTRRPINSYNGLQIWTEGHGGRFDDDLASAASSGDFEVLYAGGDFLVSRSILIGALVQFDWMRDSSDVINGKIDGRGWMAGPYIGIQIDPHWQFDARAAWGRSTNDIAMTTDVPFLSSSPPFVGSFDTDRWLVWGSLRGNWYDGPWRVTSKTELAYIKEDQKGFTMHQQGVTFDPRLAPLPSQVVALGRFTFGPEIAYRVDMGSSFIEPQLSLQGLWNFDREKDISLEGLVASPDEVTGRLEGAVMFGYRDEISFRAAAAYEGIGSNDFNAWSVRLWGSLPLGTP